MVRLAVIGKEARSWIVRKERSVCDGEGGRIQNGSDMDPSRGWVALACDKRRRPGLKALGEEADLVPGRRIFEFWDIWLGCRFQRYWAITGGLDMARGFQVLLVGALC
ncbi:hypothetical protein L2E82_06483 [Cichorium intybus]|uniref:Uncharacterized protein n=1 Tax=Cichorium intybus TaxID=13427 RepID=A0ACB9HA35_CICIN|nr:hypothetical protein L2E82_06483 [Cichorium intybus]